MFCWLLVFPLVKSQVLEIMCVDICLDFYDCAVFSFVSRLALLIPIAVLLVFTFMMGCLRFALSSSHICCVTDDLCSALGMISRLLCVESRRSSLVCI